MSQLEPSKQATHKHKSNCQRTAARLAKTIWTSSFKIQLKAKSITKSARAIQVNYQLIATYLKSPSFNSIQESSYPPLTILPSKSFSKVIQRLRSSKIFKDTQMKILINHRVILPRNKALPLSRNSVALRCSELSSKPAVRAPKENEIC